jgi:hypothetical protein
MQTTHRDSAAIIRLVVFEQLHHPKRRFVDGTFISDVLNARCTLTSRLGTASVTSRRGGLLFGRGEAMKGAWFVDCVLSVCGLLCALMLGAGFANRCIADDGFNVPTDFSTDAKPQEDANKKPQEDANKKPQKEELRFPLSLDGEFRQGKGAANSVKMRLASLVAFNGFWLAYERILQGELSSTSFGIAVGAGFGLIQSINVELFGTLMTEGEHKGVLGFGLVLGEEYTNIDGTSTDPWEFAVYPSATLAYRYQPSAQGMFFEMGVGMHTGAQWIPGVELSFGSVY